MQAPCEGIILLENQFSSSTLVNKQKKNEQNKAKRNKETAEQTNKHTKNTQNKYWMVIG